MNFKFIEVFGVLLALIFCSKHLPAQNPEVVDSILMELPDLAKKDKSPYLTELSWQYILSDIDKSYKYALQALECAEFSKDSNQLSDAYNTLGAVYMKKTNYDSAIFFNERALEIRKAQNDIRGIGGSYSKLGNIYTDQGYMDKALDYQLKALKLFIECEDPYAEAQTYNNICQIYSYLDNFEMAIFYSNKCIRMYDELDYPYGEATAIANLALYYEEKNMLDSAIYFTKKSSEIFESINDWADLGNSENMLGIYLRKQGKDQEGLQHYLKALKIAEKNEDGFSMAQFRANAAAAYLDLNMLDSAYLFYTASLKKAKEFNLLRVERQCYDGLADYFERTNNYKQSLEYRKSYEKLNDSITNIEIQESMALADAKFQSTYNKQLVLEKENIIQKEQKEKALLSKQNAEKESQLRTTQLVFTFIGSLVILAGVVVFFWVNRVRLNREKQFAQNLAKEKEKGLQKIIQAQEQERSRIARDLHDGIVQDIVAIKMSLKRNDENAVSDLAGRLDKAASEVRAISHAMMPYALKELTLDEALGDLLSKALSNTGIEKDYDFLSYSGATLNDEQKVNVYRIVQELLNNTIKHSEAKKVTVMVSIRNNFLTLTYEDDGKGFDRTQKEAGLGVLNIESRVGVLRGEMKFESERGKGVLYILKIPL
ncbi:tetratricopeptide repeat-containing sensor histidine kinase [Parvicella tangerina]|uniref:histidine kinase n=1 Tax=Parvicella tangerina TaxID=2829795 RepID=A0A916N875_9FLAO|nr:sensor histidine kinase [Parvicella tangerina]CAG5076494.1 hypothetical protein CRYO30217_00121 [Parvicella tangerina]